MPDWQIIEADAMDGLAQLADSSIHCVVTSPPYWRQRDYGCPGQIGLELTPQAYVARLAAVFAEVRRVLRPDGTLWLNIGDTYAAGGNGGGGRVMARRLGNAWAGHQSKTGWRAAPAGFKPKDLVGTSWMLANTLQAQGWWLRCCIVWDKTCATEPPRTDRPSTAHEFVFLLSKSSHYWTNPEAMPASTVWRCRPTSSGTNHPATMPARLVETCILAGCPRGGRVLDPFSGAGTVGMVALRLERGFDGIELNPTYAAESRARILADAPLLRTGDITWT